MFKLQQAKSAVYFAHLAINSGLDHADLARVSEILELVDLIFHVSSLGNDCAALERVEHLGGVQTERGQIAVVQNAALRILYPKGMRCIINEFEVMTPRNSGKLGQTGRIAVTMNRQNCRGARRDQGLDLFWVEVQAVFLDIGKNRHLPVPQYRM